VHVTGGKLTTYREMASQVVDLLAGPEAKHDRTSVLALPGGERSLDDLSAEAAADVEDAGVRDHLVRSYGTRWRDVWELGAGNPLLRERLSPSHAVIGAEMVYGAQQEMAVTLGDLLIRRTHLAFESRDQARSLAHAVLDLVAPAMQPRDREKALRALDDEVRWMFGADG
jgi:glycerol-3-phosphate dehydrogenase